ncbi:MAG TPA: zinc ribbon domain-containing protein, partial [Nitrosopumilaceae archaeon]|nr:zinc ribbon domain-containing protein [Nitrosopumilaceae archaeon]
GGSALGTTQVTGSVSMGGFGSPSPTHISSATMPGPGRPPSIVSAASAFGNPGTLPTPDPSLMPQSFSGPSCSSCGTPLKSTAKFCTKCGKKV